MYGLVCFSSSDKCLLVGVSLQLTIFGFGCGWRPNGVGLNIRFGTDCSVSHTLSYYHQFATVRQSPFICYSWLDTACFTIILWTSALNDLVSTRNRTPWMGWVGSFWGDLQLDLRIVVVSFALVCASQSDRFLYDSFPVVGDKGVACHPPPRLDQDVAYRTISVSIEICLCV